MSLNLSSFKSFLWGWLLNPSLNIEFGTRYLLGLISTYYQLFPFDKEKYEVLVAFDKVELLSLKIFSRPIICGYYRFSDNPKLPFSAIGTSLSIFVIVLLVGHILFAAVNHIKKAEEDCREMEELKGCDEASDVAKSRVLYFFNE